MKYLINACKSQSTIQTTFYKTFVLLAPTNKLQVNYGEREKLLFHPQTETTPRPLNK